MASISCLPTPAKTSISSISPILRTPFVILYPVPFPFPSLFSSTFSSKSISAGRLSLPLRAYRPHKYAYPDPIPEFAVAETKKFKAELWKKLSNDKETFGDELHTVVEVCAQIFSDFLHKEYGGPGTLLVEPFTDMLVALKERKLSGAAVAARASLLWAQKFVDQDWEVWNSDNLI
ncbi:protein PLASTID REDOX INSENSITIVE 2-like isoform X2 [Carica papaya]|uniref:protein PLASTID REDOX INSENSITIVE 2-like isoform X2 n=1 Tax=Carica papaya TaxID=3649 RepID=UPI000B8CA8FC|nr:protein PLASTID REDOX INSENSITIVE 2-like isoform X2 [Carica papaya]